MQIATGLGKEQRRTFVTTVMNRKDEYRQRRCFSTEQPGEVSMPRNYAAFQTHMCTN